MRERRDCVETESGPISSLEGVEAEVQRLRAAIEAHRADLNREHNYEGKDYPWDAQLYVALERNPEF